MGRHSSEDPGYAYLSQSVGGREATREELARGEASLELFLRVRLCVTVAEMEKVAKLEENIAQLELMGDMEDAVQKKKKEVVALKKGLPQMQLHVRDHGLLMESL